MLFNPFDDFEQRFNKIFNSYSRPVGDKNIANIYANENGYIVVANTVGIDPKDLKVNVSTENGAPYKTLTVQGETKQEKIGETFHVNIKFRLNFDPEEVTYKSQNGLTYVFLKSKNNDTAVMQGKLLDENDEIDW